MCLSVKQGPTTKLLAVKCTQSKIHGIVKNVHLINIPHKVLIDYKISFVNSQHEKANSKGDYVLKIGFKRSF